MRIVIALGGNALLRRGEPADADTQRRNVATAVAAIAELAAEHQVIVTHGNGPQVGLLALQGDAYDAVAPYPLDVLGAESEGQIGYLLDQELVNALGGRPVATLLTQVIVDLDDLPLPTPRSRSGRSTTARPPSGSPASAVGRSRPTGRTTGASWPRRSHARSSSCRPCASWSMTSVLVVCVGGGGIPVAVDRDGQLRGVEAVIDKDLAAALLARGLNADALLLLTDVPAVQSDWGTPDARDIVHASPGAMRRLAFAEGSMGPKIEAACRFAEATRGLAGIGALADAAAILRGERGTTIADVAPHARAEPDAMARS